MSRMYSVIVLELHTHKIIKRVDNLGNRLAHKYEYKMITDNIKNNIFDRFIVIKGGTYARRTREA